MDAVVPKKDKQSAKQTKLTQEQLGDKLKEVYADIAAEPVPDRFMDLIKQLESEETDEKSSESSEDQKDRS